MPNKKEIIIKILQSKPNLDRKELDEKITRKKEEMGKFLTDEGAAYMVANDLNVDLSGEKPLKTELTIKDIAVGTNDVSINGIIKAVSHVHTFQRSNGSEGKVARIVIFDKTGSVTVVLWDEKAEIAEQKLCEGDLVRVNHGYVKTGLDGRAELNVGRNGSVVILPENLGTEKMSDIKEVYYKINEISEGDLITFVGFVEGVSKIFSFIRRDNKEGKVARARLADETGRIMAVFWDEKVNFLQQIRKGSYIKIRNGYVRRGLSEELEIHLQQDSEVLLQKEPKGSKPLSPVFTKIGKLTQRMSNVDLLARVIGVGKIREFIRPSGEKGSVAELFLMDETGSIRLALWDDKVEVLKEVSIGNIVLVEGAYTRKGLGSSINLNLGKIGTIKLDPDNEEAKKLPLDSAEFTKIEELKPGSTVSVSGEISEEPLIKIVFTRDGREIKLASLKVKDGSGEIRASFWGFLADKFKNLVQGTKINITNAYVKNSLLGDLELSSRTITKVEIINNSQDKLDSIN